MSESTRDSAQTTGPAIDAHYRFILWLIPTLLRFPRSQKFLLADRIQEIAIDVLEALIGRPTRNTVTGRSRRPISALRSCVSCCGFAET